MKILIIANKFPYPPNDGGAIATLNMIASLSKLGQEVTVVAINTSKHYFDLKDLPEEVKKIADFKDVYVNTRIRPLKAILNFLFSDKPYNAVRFITRSFEKKIIEILQKEQFDIIQLEGLYLCPYIKTIRKYSTAKISLRAHNVEHEIWERISSNPIIWYKKKYLKSLSQRIKKFELGFINVYDLLVPITVRDNNAFIKYGNIKPSFACPAAIDTKKYVYKNNNMLKKTIFQMGGLDWPPNQQGILWFLAEVWHEILELYPEVEFVVAGRNAPDWFIKKIEKYKNVKCFGEVENAEKFVHNQGVMLVPLLSGSGMRIKIIEGLAWGKVILSTSIGAEGIDVKHHKNILIADTPKEMVEAIKLCFDNSAFTSILSENARALADKKFNLQSVTSGLVAFYEKNVI